MLSPRKEARKESEKHNNKEQDENPINIGPEITESYDDDLCLFLSCTAP